jgi:hypothetical protein
MKTALTLLTCFLINIAFSQSNKAVYTSLSTVGLGIGYQQQFHGKIGFDVNVNYINWRPSSKVEFLTNETEHLVSAQLNSFQGEANLKWYPFGSDYYGEYERNKFFIRAGISYKQNANLNFGSEYQVKEKSSFFDPADPRKGRIDIQLKTKNIQPYLGLGFQALRYESNFILNIEAGLFYHDKPVHNFDESGSKIYNIKNSSRANRYISYVIVYPQIKFAFGYKIPTY